MPNKHLSNTAPQPHKIRKRAKQTTNNAMTTTTPLDGSVLLLDNRFFRPGGIRVGTIENMAFRPGLAPDHMPPPPAFRRSKRVTVIPYSKGSAYREKIGIDKLAASAKTNPALTNNTRKKIITMLGGNAEKISKEIAQRKKRTQSPRADTTTRSRTGGRATKLINGKEFKAKSLFSERRPKSRLNWKRLEIEVSSRTITGAFSACSVPRR